ncbi:uncharacterized protein [Halyomorpha halys]|uniref:uncharacterized protein n=1 Tax=Halyomorpha halys TaxID=286706 RepID=UPI0006D5012A|nr:uncharacterized protein LOC106681043 isoform X1 [Halyomorpha halys]XP_014276646.1 uncharacterized protein LOC106681043 isoform X1 [Halyomorpha halys]XP_014276648.1 uncharacterized protein LOC106681043 isoform X1 [Halyomorpha halys]
MNDYNLDSMDSGLGLSPDSDPLCGEMGEISISDQDYNRIQYLSRSYIEMPQTGEVNYISTIIGVCGNPVYKGKGLWVPKSDRNSSATVKVDKDDIRAKRHYVKTLHKDGREVKIWECGLCGKEFRFQYTLVRHIPTHTDVRNYQCDICPKAFRQLSTLAQHKATHWNMRPFSCDFCQKSFNRISTLISHKKIHYDEKKHVCPFCGKGFHQKGNLRNHMYTHTNERPYKCEICNKGFNQKSNLVCHKISTHSRKDHYQCDICSISFGKQNLYSCHMESIHNMPVAIPKKQISNLWENMKTEPQCAIVDESNNILYSLPISYEKKQKGSLQEEDNNNITFCDPYKKKGDDVIAVINEEPTSAMVNLYKNREVPFVLFYESIDAQPKICKVIIQGDVYMLVNPTNTDLAKYLVAGENSNQPKFPVVASIIQKKDSSGRSQVVVLPSNYSNTNTGNGEYNNLYSERDMEDSNDRITLHNEQGESCYTNNEVVIVPKNPLKFPVQEVNGKKKGEAAIIYTKTQPNIRPLKTKKAVEACSSETTAPANELIMNNGYASSSEISNERDDTILIYVPIDKSCESNLKQNATINDKSKQTTDFDTFSVENMCFEINNNAPSSSSSLNKGPEIYLEPGVSDFKNFRSFRSGNSSREISFPDFPMNLCDKIIKSEVNCKEEKSFEIEVVNAAKQSFNIKKEAETTEILSMDDSCNDIEPTLFINSENLEKEPLSKFNLDFDGESFDILDDYSFTDSFLENAVNNGESTSIVDTFNPSSPASFIFSSL